MNNLIRRPRFVAAISLGLAALLGFQAVGVAQATDYLTYSGRATVLRANVGGVNTVLVDAGPLPHSGGERSSELKTVDLSLSPLLPSRITASLLNAHTAAGGGESRARASAADVRLNLDGVSIAAKVLASHAVAKCVYGKVELKGDAVIDQLQVNGKTVIVDRPNLVQEIFLPGKTVKLTINEHVRSSGWGSGAITVRALRISISGLSDVVVSSAHADIGGCHW